MAGSTSQDERGVGRGCKRFASGRKLSSRISKERFDLLLDRLFAKLAGKETADDAGFIDED